MDTATPPLHSRSERISPLDKNSSVKKHAPKRFDLKMEDKKKEEKDNPPSLMKVQGKTSISLPKEMCQREAHAQRGEFVSFLKVQRKGCESRQGEVSMLS